MPRISPHAAFWLLATLAAVGLLWLFAEILLPFMLGIVAAYLFDPLATRLSRSGLRRSIAAFIIVSTLTLTIVAAAALLLPLLFDQLGQLLENLPRYLEQARNFVQERWARWITPLQQQINPGVPAEGGGQQPQGQIPLGQGVAPWLIAQAQALLQSGLALFNSLALLFLTPVITFFMLKDWDKMVAQVDRLLPRQDAPTVRRLARDINDTISSYLRGMLTVLLILSAFYMIGLSLVGLNYALLIGLAAGLISFIPYLGTFIGVILGVGVAFAQFYPDWVPILSVLGVFVAGQLIENNILTPKIVGDRVHLHPVWLIFALIAFGYLLGFTGLIIAVPVAAAIGVLVRYAVRRYYESDIYSKRPAEKKLKAGAADA